MYIKCVKASSNIYSQRGDKRDLVCAHRAETLFLHYSWQFQGKLIWDCVMSMFVDPETFSDAWSGSASVFGRRIWIRIQMIVNQWRKTFFIFLFLGIYYYFLMRSKDGFQWCQRWFCIFLLSKCGILSTQWPVLVRQIVLSYRPARARICKRLRSPGIDYAY